MKSKTNAARRFFSSAFFLLAACIPLFAQSSSKQQPAGGGPVRLTAAVPTLAALAESPQSQSKGGLRITVAPEVYKAQESWTEKARRVPPPSKWGLVMQPSPTAIYVEKTRTPSVAIAPDHLVFHVNLSNGMPRVFRGSGIAVQFNIGGKLVTVDPAGDGDLVNVILAPRSEQEMTIVGPLIADIKAPSTVGVFFYDVVTGMDNAGNVTEKQNFEWYFSYQTQITEKEFDVPPGRRSWEEPY